MPYLKAKNPYNPGYALPKNVLAEPEVRGTLTTKKAPGGTIDSYRPAKKNSFWDSGYSLPANVRAETPGKGVSVTAFASRGTIDSYVSPTYREPTPTTSAQNEGLGSLGGSSLGNYDDVSFNSRSHTGLSGTEGKDPFAQQASDLADEFLAKVKSYPADKRSDILRAMLNTISSTIAHDVDTKAARLRKREPSMPASEVLQRAMAASFANHMVELFQAAGKSGGASLGCADCKGCSGASATGAYQDLGWGWGITDSIQDAASWVKDKVKSAVCTAANNRYAIAAAAGTATIAGSPAAGASTMAGARTLASVCDGGGGSSSGSSTPPPQAPPVVDRKTISARNADAFFARGMTRAPNPSYDASSSTGSLIPGVSNMMLAGGVAVVGLGLFFMTRHKKA